jgi:hypothetical protein
LKGYRVEGGLEFLGGVDDRGNGGEVFFEHRYPGVVEAEKVWTGFFGEGGLESGTIVFE